MGTPIHTVVGRAVALEIKRENSFGFCSV